jgi:hypothetical protein
MKVEILEESFFIFWLCADIIVSIFSNINFSINLYQTLASSHMVIKRNQNECIIFTKLAFVCVKNLIFQVGKIRKFIPENNQLQRLRNSRKQPTKTWSRNTLEIVSIRWKPLNKHKPQSHPISISLVHIDELPKSYLQSWTCFFKLSKQPILNL